MKKLFSNKKNEKGQGLVEYAIILALIALVVIGVMTTLGKKVNGTYVKVSSALAPTTYMSMGDAYDGFCAENPGVTPNFFYNPDNGSYVAVAYDDYGFGDPSPYSGYQQASGGWGGC
jgi:pilus assembly protein Flp/PilA